MNFQSIILFGIIAVMAGGCKLQPYSPIFYTDLPVQGLVFADYSGSLTAEKVNDKSEEELIKECRAQGYVLIGRADFSAPSLENWTQAMVENGRKVKAEKIYYRTWYVQKDNLPGLVDVHTTYAATRSDIEHHPVDTHLIADYGTMEMASNHNYDYNEYHVYYFRKLK